MSKHVWINKRTDKGIKPVREWIECKNCGLHRTTENGSLPDDHPCEKATPHKSGPGGGNL